jgi:formate hydrogenlyase subunit 4
MITELIHWLFFLLSVLLAPIVILGTIRKTKARLQARRGAPILQAAFDLIRLAQKGETVSSTASWIFRAASTIGLCNVLLISWLVPWLSFAPWAPPADLFLVVYLFAMSRIFTLLAALDTGSAFGAFGASREATLSLLVEPAALLGLVALGATSRTSDLREIFSFTNTHLQMNPAIWLLVGTAIILSSLVELSRMPIDDPTTHLELTMVHEAMILEASGRNLAIIEFTHALRMSVLFGLSVQCFMRAAPAVWKLPEIIQAMITIIGLLTIAMAVGVFESLAVKLQWRRIPEFIAYAITMSLLAALIAVAGGIV